MLWVTLYYGGRRYLILTSYGLRIDSIVQSRVHVLMHNTLSLNLFLYVLTWPDFETELQKQRINFLIEEYCKNELLKMAEL